MNEMAVSNDDLLEIPSMSVLRRPLTEAEARKWEGDSEAARRDALAALTRLVENDDELAAELTQLLLYRRIYDAMSTELLDPQHGSVVEFEAGIRETERSFAGTFR